jgi:hypothetical protein
MKEAIERIIEDNISIIEKKLKKQMHLKWQKLLCKIMS